MEAKLLALLIQSKLHFAQLEQFSIRDSFSELGRTLYDYAASFYAADPQAIKVDLDLVRAKIERDLPRQKDILFACLNNLPSEVSAPNLLNEIIACKRESLSRDLAGALLSPYKAGVAPMMEEFLALETSVNGLGDDLEEEVPTTVQGVFEQLSSEHRIRLWPKGLNELCGGGAVRGHNILVFGRPEVGKSGFLINMVGGFLHDGHKVLFIENEDPTNVTLARIICRITGMLSEEIKQDVGRAQQLCEDRGYANLIFRSLAPGTLHEIQGLVDKHAPVDVVILNQLRNLFVGREDRVNALEKAATGARNIAKQNSLCFISSTQAGDSASEKAVLDMGDVDFSNTGIPGAMDLMIGIGCTKEMEGRGQRMISLPKNKLSGQHAYFPVTFDTRLSKVTT